VSFGRNYVNASFLVAKPPTLFQISTRLIRCLQHISRYETPERGKQRVNHLATSLLPKMVGKWWVDVALIEAAHEKRTKTPTTFLSRW
jgi:hypothetical protein